MINQNPKKQIEEEAQRRVAIIMEGVRAGKTTIEAEIWKRERDSAV